MFNDTHCHISGSLNYKNYLPDFFGQAILIYVTRSISISRLLAMNECLMTPQHEKQIGYWVLAVPNLTSTADPFSDWIFSQPNQL